MDSGVQFDEEDPLVAPRQIPAAKNKKVSLITRLAISWGFAKDERSAQGVLLIIVVILIVLTLGVIFLGNPVVQTGHGVPGQINPDLQPK